MAAEAQRATRSREQTSFAARLRAFWRYIEPGIDVDRNNFIENWSATGEGRATAVSFEGFGISLFLTIGRTPKERR
ncbi:hypothetical protein [Sphingomonas sp. BK069]|uniref:hypothetical protein n=1 Tax=Sphingomonas sp. BK069 TaxID=2586979 RepID=UPI001608AD81|nr:hypothetical protein [Sphingomonas sp. BK069]MBB3347340.1 hypothetical protein [Sphingomonas sp. BK069]